MRGVPDPPSPDPLSPSPKAPSRDRLGPEHLGPDPLGPDASGEDPGSVDAGIEEAVQDAVAGADEVGLEAALEQEEVRQEQGRHATNVELFLDLVFVFAVTQVAGVLSHDLTWPGFGRGLLLAWMVWWLWSQFTWLGTALDLGSRSMSRFLVLVAVPPALLMAVALPEAYGATGVQFAAAYLSVNLWSLAIQGHNLWGDPPARGAWLRYLPLAALAPVALFAGSFLHGDARITVWAAVAVFTVASALAAGTQDQAGANEWKIDATHFAERHALFVIISLGEVLVAVGAAASGDTLTTRVGMGLVATVTLACVFWWSYFAYVPEVVEHALARAVPRRRGQVARDLFTFGHFPIVFGLVLYAVAAKHVVPHPTEPLAAADLAALAGAVLLFVGGLAGLQWQVIRRIAPERVAVVVLVGGLCAFVGPHVSAVAVVVAVGVSVAAQQTVTLRSYERRAAAGG